MFKKVLILFILIIHTNTCFATEQQIHKAKISEEFTFETHKVNNNTEDMGVAGFIYKRYLDNNWFWGGAGYAALFGQRGGYFIGGFLTGYTLETTDYIFEPLIYIGAGGGHSAPSGASSGGLIRWSIALGYKVTPDLSIKLHTGYIDFIGGDIKSWLAGFTIGITSYEIFSK